MTSLVRRNLHRPDAADPRITALLGTVDHAPVYPREVLRRALKPR